jgi:phospholipid/cholesterol/gamma-HCH transport system ATP-binding protein
MISVRNLHKRFGSQVVLNGVNLEIEPGKTTAVVGPSGVGKSVLLKLIMGIMTPDEGEVLIGGHNMTAARSERSKNEIRNALGVLFQSAALFDSLTIYDNIAFSLRERMRLSASKAHARVLSMADSLSLTPYLKNFPEQVSIGIRKRVGMARALISEPKVLLVDEPNTGLDPLDGQEVYDLINACKNQWGFTGLVISHELPEVFQVSDRVAMILNGGIIIEGTPAELAASENPAVQQFLNGRTDGPIKIQ